MDLRAVIASAIALGSTSGGCSGPCPSADFELDELVTGSQIDAFSASDADPEARCEEACSAALFSTGLFAVKKVDSCTLGLDPGYVPATDTAVGNDGPGGRVICSGTAYEGACL